ncbi:MULTISPECIES: cytochrome b [Methylobacterium]|uniref:cytochrome b n=1 Tax=Methylobacterium TaxID=407 RepID=UPI00036EBDAE|nr:MULTISPECIES: cytochrome b [Methylobacterium]MBN4094250.1 cytochrome b [Methylobacterium sp. OT2]UIN33327.1 cytochrome b [Methylobacterium oryzae]
MSGSPLTAGKAPTALPATYVTASGLPRYHPVSQALHWLNAALVLAVLPLAWVAISLPPTPAKGSMFVLHKSVGLTILAIVVVRILWRMIRPAPPDPHAPRLLTLIGRVNHFLLYAIFLIMPISGYLLSALSGRDTPYFWLFTIPGLPKDDATQKIFESIHVFGQWLVYALVLLHIAGTAWHLVIRRDGLLERMLPVQDGRGSSR